VNNVPLPKCPICGSNRAVRIGKPQVSSQAAKFVNADYHVVKCNRCRFYYVFPQIPFDERQWEGLYQDEYFGEMPRWWARKRAKDRKQRLDWLQEHSQRSISTFLDVGCGEGYVLTEALQRRWSTYGVDIFDNRMELAKGKSIAFFRGDIFQASFPNDFFDCIYMDSVLEHVLDPSRQLCEVRRILREGGVAYIGVPNEDCLFNDVKRLLYILSGRRNLSARLWPFKPPYHIIGFTEESLRKVLDRSGLEIVRFRNFAGEYEWRKFKCFTKPFLINLFLLPIHLIAIPLRKRIYFDVIVRKSDQPWRLTRNAV